MNLEFNPVDFSG